MNNTPQPPLNILLLKFKPGCLNNYNKKGVHYIFGKLVNKRICEILWNEPHAEGLFSGIDRVDKMDGYNFLFLFSLSFWEEAISSYQFSDRREEEELLLRRRPTDE